MQADGDPHAGLQYPSRPIRHLTGPNAPTSRGISLPSISHNPVTSPSTLAFASSSAAATRYSPLVTLSPISQFAPKSIGFPPGGTSQHQQSQPQSPHQYPQQPPPSLPQMGPDSSLLHSPNRNPIADFSSPQQQSPYMSSRQYPHLPPLSPYMPQGPASHTFKTAPASAPASASILGSFDQYPPPTLDAPFSFGADPNLSRRYISPSMSLPVPNGPVPEFKPIHQVLDLRPKKNTQPLFRRANPEGGFISPLQALTVHLPSTYRICNPNFKYESSRNPRRVLTKPSKGVKNDGFDNEDSDYILYVNDILGSEETGHKNRYLILDVLGQGTFGQVVKCQNLKTQEVVAVKVIKNRTAYFNQSMMEVSVLDLLNTKLDKNDDHHLLRLKDTFIHRQHLCLVFELLSVNLYELIKQNQFRGLSTTLVRVFAQQLLNGLALLNKARLIHCDLKPENILLKNLESPIIKIIDFGSACDERQTVYTYIQSRFYRSPEVLLGLPYSSAIDMWSLGCIVVELFLGLPLFPGSSEYNQVARIVEMLGNPPNWMIEMGKQGGEFFEKRQDEFGRRAYQLKSMEQYSREHSSKEQPSKKYFQASTLPQIINTYPMPRKDMKQSEVEREMNSRISFMDFVRGLLTINPLERWSPQQAKLHPFITQQKYLGPFVPPMNLKSTSLNRSPAPGVQQQLQAEALSKQRAQAAQAQANSAAQGSFGVMNPGQYPQPSQTLYGNNSAYSPNGALVNAPPPYDIGSYGQMAMSQPPQQQMNPNNYGSIAQQEMLHQSHADWTTEGLNDGAAAERYPPGYPACRQPVGSQSPHPAAAQPSLLSTACRRTGRQSGCYAG